MGSFSAQFWILCWKNGIILWRHKFINLVRCILLPIAYAVFFAKAQAFFTTQAVLGPGHISDLQTIPAGLLGHTLVWSPPQSAATNATVATFVDQLMDQALNGVSGKVLKVDTHPEINTACPENFNGLSECFMAVQFNGVDPANYVLNYTMRGDFGLTKVDVDDHPDDDVQQRALPLQWAIESAFVQMTTGTVLPSPLNWEYTNETQYEWNEANRLSYLRGIRSLIVLAHFLVFLGVVYQLPGGMASERASSLTAHLDAMGCRKSARIMSWNLSISAAYLIAWVLVAVIFQHFIYLRTNAGLLVILYITTGFSLASWTHLVAVPFAKSPTLAAITATFLAIILAIGALLSPSSPPIQLVLTFIFPPMYYIFFTKALSAWETLPASPNILYRSPKNDAPILGLLIIAIIDIFLFPLIASWLEDRIYGVRNLDRTRRTWFGKRRLTSATPLPSGTAVEVMNLRKEYSTKRFGIFGRGKPVVAIEDLSFSVPKGEIFCLLGRNGAAKSTTLSAIARLLNISRGHIQYADDLHLGIASQKDILWDELTCKQHVRLWRAIKTTREHRQAESDVDLLARCDLAPKIQFKAEHLSGGQKRKLALACALAGGSNLLLLDEISSGLDPLARRAIWRLITANRGPATVLLTTHFLDEADYLGDQVAILQAPGRLLALDNPVALKNQLGQGLSISTNARQTDQSRFAELRRQIPNATVRANRGKEVFSIGNTDFAAVRSALSQWRRGLPPGYEESFAINSASLEDVFLDLNAERRAEDSRASTLVASPIENGSADDSDLKLPTVMPLGVGETASPSEKTLSSSGTPSAVSGEFNTRADSKDVEKAVVDARHTSAAFTLTPGRKPSPFRALFVDAWTIFRKRLIVLRRSWLLPVIAIAIVICAACIPLFFVAGRRQSCEVLLDEERLQQLSYPNSVYPFAFSPLILAPANALGDFALPTHYVETLANNASFVNAFQTNLTNITFGGVSLASGSAQSLFAWEGSALTNKGLSALNLVSNALLDQLRPPASLTGAFRINLSFRYLASPNFTSTAQAIKWVAFFGLGIAVWPAFACLYPTQERASNVRANHYSNGGSPAALWLGHLLFELPAILLVSTVITIVFALASSQFSGPGTLWICFVLYGISATLYSFLFALWLNSALAAWALVAGTNVILFLLYLASYLLILTYDRSSAAPNHITIAHFTIGLINPVPNIMRAALVSVNLFNLLCDGLGNYSSTPYSNILKFGGPIMYLVLQAVFAFSVLVYVDSGSPLPTWLIRGRRKKSTFKVEAPAMVDVIAEKERLERGVDDTLRVSRLRKRYNGAPNIAVDDVSFGVTEGETFALIGPNGAGKTTTLACIRGVEFPTGGDVFVNSHSIVNARNAARSYLGVCPQVNAIDSNLTVRQHLWLYGRLKGVPRKALNQDVATLLAASGLSPKADQLATSLSGGNQRKLSLGMALIGDRPVVLIDEFSSGVDPFSKREAWATLERLTKDRAVVMTTHSMEEVDALASRVGIIASRMLAVGTPGQLKSRYATYEIHLAGDAVQPMLDYLQENGFPDARRSLDTTTRISIPGVREESLEKLLGVLDSAKHRLDLGDLAIHEASTETAFLEIVRAHNVQEEEAHHLIQKDGWFKRLLAKRTV